jgi:tetratricopeptide (TPR) repeat protein
VYTNPSEGMRWVDSLLSDGVPLELRARALRVYGSCANPAGENELAERAYEESFRAFQELGDGRGVAHLLLRLGSSALYRDDRRRALDLAEQSLALARRVGDRPTESLALWLVGDAEQALGNPDRGIEMIRKSAELAGEIGFAWQRTRMLRRLADWSIDHGDLVAAAEALHESLSLSREIGDRISVVFALARLARVAAATGDPEQAGRLWGAIEAEERRGGLGAWHDQRSRFEGPVLEEAGPDFERGRAEGRLLSFDEAVAAAAHSPAG